MAEEEVTPEDTGEAFGSAEEVSPAADVAGESPVEATEPQGEEAFAGDANNEGGDEANSSEQGVGQGAPEEYGEFTLPEGFNVDEEGMTLYMEESKERGLSQEQAQAELDNLIKWKSREDANIKSQMVEQAGAWTQASKAAGLMTAESRSMASVGLKALDHDGSAGAVLRERGLDRHPAIVAAFKAYGTSISNDQRVPGVDSVGGSVTKSAAEILYPNQK